MTLPRPTSTFREINNLIHKSYLPKIILTAIEVGIFDALYECPMSATDTSWQHLPPITLSPVPAELDSVLSEIKVLI